MRCDEYHVIFECPSLCPRREQFSSLFTPATQSMLGFMWQKDAHAVAVILACCLRHMDVANTKRHSVWLSLFDWTWGFFPGVPLRRVLPLPIPNFPVVRRRPT
jgi:hypothetical protein